MAVAARADMAFLLRTRCDGAAAARTSVDLYGVEI